MMLQALVAYAEREGLGADPDFEARPVDYRLEIDASGRFLGLIPLGPGKDRAPLGGLPMGPLSRSQPGSPCFVVDNALYVLGIAKEDAQPGNAEKCRGSYQKLIQLAHEATADDALGALAKFLARPDQIEAADGKLKEREKKPEARGNCVLVPALGGCHIHERSAVATWWKSKRSGERANAEAGPLGRCLITGKRAPVARTHPPLKGSPFPGTGAKLVAYDKAAFGSHDLEQGDNAPVSEAAAQKYTAALNALLERDKATGRRKAAVDLDRESVVVFWTREESEAAAFVLDVLSPPAREADAADAAMAPWRGRAPATFDATPFYAVTLGVNSARVVVRDWFETPADRVKADLVRWFADLHVGPGDPEPVPLEGLMRALQATPDAAKDKRGLPPGIAATVFRAALLGAPLPRTLLIAAVARMRIPANDQDALRLRVAVIRAVLRRQRPNPVEVSVALDESRTDPAYLLGRLFATLEKLQLVASQRGNDLNATIRDRYYGAASTRPATVFPTLLRLSVHHAAKTKEDGLGILAEKAKAKVMNQLVDFPGALGLEDQGLFAIGYYHQRQAFFTPKAAKASDTPQGGTSP
jgi:CRISPR-associated protein Csd1